MKNDTKNRVLKLLEASSGDFISGEAVARELGVTRNSVWKAINALKDDGYGIESVTKKGYHLDSSPDVFTAERISSFIESSDVPIVFYDSVSSTNTQAKKLADEGAPHATLVVANSQSAGRGRQGRSFSSPKDTGAYFTLILRPGFSLKDVSLMTTYAACCLAGAIDECAGKHAQIKWVNDVFVDGRKVSGILSEASIDAETQSIAYVVVGIGVNVIEPEGGFDDEAGIAGALVKSSDAPNELRCRIIAGTVDRFMQGYGDIPNMPHLQDYRSRSLLDGMRVEVQGSEGAFDALVEGVNDDFTLRVRLDDGTVRHLASGEVHIPSSQLSR